MVREWSLVCMRRVYNIVTAEDAAASDIIASTRLIVEYGYGRPMQDLERKHFDVDKRVAEAQIKKLEKDSSDGALEVTVGFDNDIIENGWAD